MALAKAKNSIFPTTGDTSFLVTPEDYTVEIFEIGVSKTNPISGATNATKQWLLSHRNGPDNEILWQGTNPIRLNVGPGKKMRDNLVLNQPNLGIYSYNYILLRKSLTVKVNAEFQDGEKFFSKKTSKSTKQDENDYFSGFIENIVNFNFNDGAWDEKDGSNQPGSSSYFKDDTKKVEGLLLDSNKTKSTSASDTEYILAVYDSTSSPLNIKANGSMNIVFSSTDGAQINCGDWSKVAGEEEDMSANTIMTIHGPGEGMFVFNNRTSWNSNLKYVMDKGVFICTNIPVSHAMACLNKGYEHKIWYGPVDDPNNPITIKVSDGGSNGSGDYFTFKDENDLDIDAIGQGDYRFMRGRTYKFQANGITNGFAFKVFMKGAFINNNNNSDAGITGSTDSIIMHIPYYHSTTAGDLYYNSVQSNTVVTALQTTSQVNIEEGGPLYIFNGSTNYQSNLRHSLAIGTYTLQNVPVEHPIAILNNGMADKIKFTIQPNTLTPEIIKVSGGSSTISGNDYFTFNSQDDNAIDIGGGGLKFQRGRTYKFQADGIDSNYNFKVYHNGAWATNNNNSTDGISGSTDSITITIPEDHSTTAGDFKYEAAEDSSMTKNFSWSYKTVSGTVNDGSYDFFYGNVVVTVTADFNVASLYCWHHGYMGGENLFQSSTVASATSNKVNLLLYNKAVTGTTNDGSYDFFYGTVYWVVYDDFDLMSVYCWIHSYMGGENLLKFPGEHVINFSSLPPKYSTVVPTW